MDDRRVPDRGHPTSVVISLERADAPDAVSLIGELEADLEPLYPEASRHGFSVDQLLAANVDFFVGRSDGTAACCGGIQIVDDEYGEIKRMYVRPRFRGSGFGKRMLDHLSARARSHGITLLRLETGIHQREAIGLYEQTGFTRIPPFGSYANDPLSLYYEKRMPPRPSSARPWPKPATRSPRPAEPPGLDRRGQA